MTTFANKSFSALSYAVHRPTYPPALYSTVLAYHQGPRTQHLDLGTGPGLIPRMLAAHFTRSLGTDPSSVMIGQAQKLTPTAQFPHVSFRVGTAEDMSSIPDRDVDLVTAGQAAHWFDYARAWPELARVVRPGGTLAFWGYKDHVFVNYPRATRMVDEFCYGEGKGQMGSYWEPGRFIVRGKLRAVVPPEWEWVDVQRVEYEPGTKGKGTGVGTAFVTGKMTVGGSMEYLRTFSAFHEWEKAHPGRKKRREGGEGDIVDELYDEIKKVEGWTEDLELEIEWGSALLMARRRETA
ncbi:putative S-adenosylmethionine-dependent methyltransferase [Trichodelitschia bisporula]|uniref:Putative S-adenosylmethionine-dependent methyltransferase n=1 Tax=Trichodelitschia bisporula TaxID=703511 RepID=A0A6G1I5F1_9PEZI|nr:putative S-adenosylmethionine-dependent methyltransferase [Trichodelitschia bisporula]